MIKYQITGIHAHIKVDDISKGLINLETKSENEYYHKLTISAKSQSKLLEKIKHHFEVDGVSKGNILLNSCGESGRIDVQRFENNSGELANAKQLEDFTEGRRTLNFATYTMHLEKVQSVTWSDDLIKNTEV